MIQIKKFIDLTKSEREALDGFLNNKREILPYHTIGFGRVIKDIFNYMNFSLVAFDDDGRAIGYLPQWRKGAVIESVPWRDKGGPVYIDSRCEEAFIEETKSIVRKHKLKGLLWKDYQTNLLENYKYFVNFTLDTTKFDRQLYWDQISHKVRGKIRRAVNNGLKFKIEDRRSNLSVKSFYNLFILNRKRLGVPVYPFKLFESYDRNIPQDQMRILSIYKENRVISSLILLYNQHVAIDAYSASDREAFILKANDMMIYNVINYCMDRGIKYFDFGADSPLQKSLIDFKSKWLGERRIVTTSYWGSVREIDHNQSKHNFMRKMIRNTPLPFYVTFSRIAVR